MNMRFLPPALEILFPLQKLSPESKLLKKLCAAMWEDTSPAEICSRVQVGTLAAYATGSALVLLETVEWSKGRELHVYGMAGRDILKNAASIISDLKLIAEYKGCSMIGGTGVPAAWRRAAPNIGFKPVSTHYVMEL